MNFCKQSSVDERTVFKDLISFDNSLAILEIWSSRASVQQAQKKGEIFMAWNVYYRYLVLHNLSSSSQPLQQFWSQADGRGGFYQVVKFQLQKAIPRTTIQKLISPNTYIGRGFMNLFRKTRRKQCIRIRHFCLLRLYGSKHY